MRHVQFYRKERLESIKRMKKKFLENEIGNLALMDVGPAMIQHTGDKQEPKHPQAIIISSGVTGNGQET